MLVRAAVPMQEPFRISSGVVERKDAVLLRLGDEAAWGWGESSAMPGNFYSAETPDSCEQELADIVVPGLMGREFASMLDLEAELQRLSSSRFVRVAVENAAWEWIARQRGMSLRRLFGLPHVAIPSGLAVGLYETADELKKALLRYQPEQYKRLKLKIKRGQDIAVVEAGRSVVGDFPLFVDANADYTVDDLETFTALDQQQLMMFEQPMASRDLDGSAQLQARVKTPVCMDESIETAADAEHAIAMDACRIVNIKLQRVGGYLEALRIIQVCEAHNVPVWMGTMPELGVGSAQALMLASHPAFRYPTDVEPSLRWYTGDLVAPSIELKDGFLHLPDGPGAGFDVDMKELERYAVRCRTFTA